MNNITLYTGIGKRLSSLRHENKLTQLQLAEALDISVKHLSETERGVACLSLEKLILACEILSTNMDYLIRGIQPDINKTVPSFVVDLFTSDDPRQIELVTDYLLMYKKISSK